MIPNLPFLATKPEIEIHLRFEWHAFWTISTDRQIGMSLGPIPWTSIDRYASRYRIEGDSFDRLSRIIRLMDAVYRDYHKSKT